MITSDGFFRKCFKNVLSERQLEDSLQSKVFIRNKNNYFSLAADAYAFKSIECVYI